MKIFMVLFLAILALGMIGCKADLIVLDQPAVDFEAKTIQVKIKNIGSADAGRHLTYVEISRVGLPASDTPESQATIWINEIKKGEVWTSEFMSYPSFSKRRGSTIDLDNLTSAKIVVRADAKNMIEESNEDNNVYDQDH